MIVFRMPWKQETVELDNVILVLKTLSISRLDNEVINTEGDEDIVSWEEKARLTSIFEIYPDRESYDKRVIPITMIKDTLSMPFNEVIGKDLVGTAFEALKDREDDIQEFWKGEVITIE